MNPELTLCYVDGENIGYGRLGVFMAKELARRGITVYNDDGNPKRTGSATERKLNGRYMSDTPDEPVVLHLGPDPHGRLLGRPAPGVHHACGKR